MKSGASALRHIQAGNETFEPGQRFLGVGIRAFTPNVVFHAVRSLPIGIPETPVFLGEQSLDSGHCKPFFRDQAFEICARSR